MAATLSQPPRKGARRMSDVPPAVLARLAAGDAETVNLMEWLAADMPALARATASGIGHARLSDSLLKAATGMAGLGVTDRLKLAGAAIVAGLPLLEGDHFERLAQHKSDLIRQWACYAVNSRARHIKSAERLNETLRFAADSNMSVREAAWMAFRPYVAEDVGAALSALEPLTLHNDANIRRFCIEVSRPRSVWGAHIEQLKRAPEQGLALLENTRADSARYVCLSVGNWLNDAAKTCPEWVETLCLEWLESGHRQTTFIVRRATRNLPGFDGRARLS